MLTWVTGFFDLRGRGGNKSVETYLAQARNLLCQDQYMIIFIDPTLTGTLTTMRDGHMDKTLIIPLEFEDLPFYAKFYERTVENLRRNPLLNGNPTKDTPAYFVLNWSKISLVKRAIELNQFGATHFGWIDFGITHVAQPCPLQDIVEYGEDKIRLLCMRHTSRVEMADLRTYYSYRWGKIAGGLFTGSIANLTRMCTLFERKLEQTQSEGWAIMDEQLFSLIYHENEELFRPYYGDYETILLNYTQIRGSVNVVLDNVRWCLERQEFAKATDVCRALLDSKVLSPTQRFQVIFDLYLATVQLDLKASPAVLDRLRTEAGSDSALFNVIRDKYPQIRQQLNFGLVGLGKPLVGTTSSGDFSSLTDAYQIIVFHNCDFSLDWMPPANPLSRPLEEKALFNSLRWVSSPSELSGKTPQ